jgi:hypothetical protein
LKIASASEDRVGEPEFRQLLDRNRRLCTIIAEAAIARRVKAHDFFGGIK